MNDPSIASSSDMPAANRIGRHRIAYHGSPAASALPAITRRATSVAVSNFPVFISRNTLRIPTRMMMLSPAMM
jgi:hypothetical protein